MAVVVVVYEILPWPEFRSGFCCVDDARSERSPLRWCHQSWVQAGGYHPSVGARHPPPAHHLSADLDNFTDFCPGEFCPESPLRHRTITKAPESKFSFLTTSNTETPRKDRTERQEFVKGQEQEQEQDGAAVCSWLCSAVADLRLKVYHNCLLTQVRSLKDTISPLCRT